MPDSPCAVRPPPAILKQRAHGVSTQPASGRGVVRRHRDTSGAGNRWASPRYGRRDFMRAVLSSAQTTGDRIAPWQRVGDVDVHFDDEADLLVELHREWLRLLVGRLHRGEVVPAAHRRERPGPLRRDLRRQPDPARHPRRARRQPGPVGAHRPGARHAGAHRRPGADQADSEQAARCSAATLVTQRIPLQRGASADRSPRVPAAVLVLGLTGCAASAPTMTRAPRRHGAP